MFTMFVDMVTLSAIGYVLFIGAKWTERTVRSMRSDRHHAESESSRLTHRISQDTGDTQYTFRTF